LISSSSVISFTGAALFDTSVSCSNGIAFVSTTDDDDDDDGAVVVGTVEFWFIIAGRRILKKEKFKLYFSK
jgi:hypothetical protein